MIKVAPYLFRGPRPTPQELIANDIKVVINLESGAYEDFHDDAYEHFKDAVIILHKTPMSDFFPPSAIDVGTALYFINLYTNNGILKVNTYVHCLTGKDRTGFVIAAYRMQVQSWSFEKAHAEWVSLGRHFWYSWWRFALKKWEK